MGLQKTRFLALISLMGFTLISLTLPALARWGDGTGPAGLGPMTGRGAGYCAGYSVPGYQNTMVPRRGYWRTGSWGGGRGYRNIYNATGLTRWQRVPTTAPLATAPPVATAPSVFTKEQQLEALKKQAEYLKIELENITRLIKDINSEKE